MELACPKCETHFFVDDNAIVPNGRKVRCSVCEHVWEAKPAPAAKPAASPAPAAPAAPARPVAPARTVSDDEFHWPAEAASESSAKDKPAPTASKPETAAKAPEPKTTPPAAPAAPADKAPERTHAAPAYASPLETSLKPQPTHRRSGGKRLVLGVVLLIFVALTYGFREQIIQALPKAAPLYRMAGIPVGMQQSQLSVTDVQFTGVDQNGTAMIRVTGLVVNNGTIAAAVPELEVLLTGTDGSIHSQKRFSPQQTSVEPNQPVRFEYDINGNASSIASAAVTLAPPGN